MEIMADGTQQVLDMLASGAISPEEAGQLLDALQDDPAPRPAVTAGFRDERRGRRERRKRDAIRPEIAQLADAAMFGVDEDFVRALREAGYTGLTISDLIELAKYGVDKDFIEGLQRAGYTGLSAEELVEMAKYGADAEFVEHMRSLGFTDLSPEELAHMAKVGVNPGTVAVMRDFATATAAAEDVDDTPNDER
jgi:hypothetical protein